MIGLTILTEEQVYGENKLKIFDHINPRAAVTDTAILRGAFVSDYHVDGDDTLSGRTGFYWLQNSDGDGDARGVGKNGDRDRMYCDKRNGSVRAALPSSFIQLISPNFVRGTDGLERITFGFYPGMAANKTMQGILEGAYNLGTLTNLGKGCTFDARQYDDYSNGFLAEEQTYYEYNGEKYTRIRANSDFGSGEFTLSNGEKYKDNDYVWVKVEPVTWIRHPEDDYFISEKAFVSGIRFYKEQGAYDGDFNKTELKWFLDNHLSKDLEILNSLEVNAPVQKEESEKSLRKQNPYGFDFSNVSEEDIIKGALESNIAVFLHGRSSEGKSARVKQFDPDPEIIYLRNATPESLNGKSVFNSETGEMIDVAPTWFKRLTKKCEDEPDKLHVVFFDEITNALPSIQGMAFNIVLDGEVNGMWRLPKNARIVAAGNDLNDSLAANTMAEPLFNRFAHVYINTTTSSWLKWAATPKKSYERVDYKEPDDMLTIHPAIYAYVAYKSYGGKDVLRTPYDGQKPNADPRKWEMASKVLYATKKPSMLRALIGEELTRDFNAFARQSVITTEDVINNNYNDIDLEMNVSEKFATAVGLSSVDDKNLQVIRCFVKKLGAEILATFDSLWSHGDEARLEKIAELKLAELSEGGIKK